MKFHLIVRLIMIHSRQRIYTVSFVYFAYERIRVYISKSVQVQMHREWIIVLKSSITTT